ncbi:RHS repeat-associated core domain-containing protein [Aliikangiella sp. IMCC44359]|uniref:RHS repeat-associated core domain-containing protein n=1 Tax=Aliikangiella sp. IMCC44359 TaxID=3459125 RepID=UPI00403A936B
MTNVVKKHLGFAMGLLSSVVVTSALAMAPDDESFYTSLTFSEPSRQCTILQNQGQTSCDIGVNLSTYRVYNTSGTQTDGRVFYYQGSQVAATPPAANFTLTVTAGEHAYFVGGVENTSSSSFSGNLVGVYEDYTPLFTHSASTHNSVVGDFDGNGEWDTYYQPKVADTIGGIMPVVANAYLDSTIHKAWTTTHPQIAAISDWSEASYAAFSGNFNSNPGDELLLLGHKTIILLHGDIITPIVTFPEVNNAIVSWDGSNQASHSEFEFDANPADYVVHVGDLTGDGYDEIFLQAKTKGSSSHILSNTGALIQTLNSGFMNMDWSAESYSINISDTKIYFSALNASDDDNIAYTNNSGAVISLANIITKPTISPGIDNKFVFEGLLYRYAPTVEASSGTVIFSQSGKPSWMSFDPTTGVLSGTPTASDINQSHTITLTAKEDKTHTIPVTLSVNIEVVERFSINQANYSVYKDASGTLYLVSNNGVDVYKIVEDNGVKLTIKISMAEFNAANATLQTDYQVEFADRNYDGNIDIILVPINNANLDTILINYINAEVHEVFVIGEPMRKDLNHGPTTLPTKVDNPLDGTDLATVVGSLPADFSVKPSGSAIYNVPITVAPGSAGMVPNLSVSYDSLAGNGIMGVGWNISGLSVISLCPTNKEQDGVTVPSKFGAGVYCINGKKLYQYGTATDRFATEDKTSINITRDVVSNGIDSQFTEHHTDGSKTIFKRVRANLPQHMIYRKVDPAGNYIEMVYESSSTEAPRLKRVLYTGNIALSQSPFNEIEFEYEDRNDDIYKYYNGFEVSITKRLKRIVSKVNVNSSGIGDELRTYTMRYIYGGVSQRSLIAGITACRSTSCLPETTFDWEQGSKAYAEQYKYENGDRYHNSKYGTPWGYLYLDFDGDGVIDYWKNKDDEGEDQEDDLLVVKGGDTFEQIEALDNFLDKDLRYSIKVIDYNNDGKDDVIYKKAGYWHIILAKQISATRFHDFDNPINTGIPVQTNKLGDVLNLTVQVADHNGDGYPDITYIHDNKIWLRYNLNVDLNTPPNQNLFGEAIQLNLIPYLTDIPPNELEDHRIEREKLLKYFFSNTDKFFNVFDIDGDGVAEYQVGIPQRVISDRVDGDWVLFSKVYNGSTEVTEGNLNPAGTHSDSFYATSYAQWERNDYSSTYDGYETQFVDLNGDGLRDVFSVYSIDRKMTLFHGLAIGTPVFASNGTPLAPVYEEPVSSPGTMESYGDGGEDYHEMKFYFVDYNSDGYQDLIHGSEFNNNTYVRYFDGKKFLPSEQISIATTGLKFSRIMDVNGDGLLDFAYFEGRMYHRLSTSKKRDLISGIYDGSSLKRTIEYSTDVHTKDDDAAEKSWGNGSLVTDVGGSIHLVKTTKKMSGDLNTCDATSCFEWFDFEYKGLKAQIGRGLLGYREFNITDHVQNRIVNNEYRQDFPFTGLLKSRTIVTGITGEQSKENLSVLYNENSFGLAYAQETTIKNYENNLLLSEKTVTNLNVDEFGNPGIIETLVVDSINSENFSTTEVFEYGLHNLHFGGRLERKTTTYSRANETPITQVNDFEYFSNTGLLHKKIVDPSDKVGSSGADESSQVYGITETYERDSFGNITSTEISGTDDVKKYVKVEFDSLGRYAEYQHSYPDYPSVVSVITTETSFHSIFGTKTSETSANGQTTYFGYSLLGRLNFQNAPDGTYTTVKKVLCSTVSDCPTRAYYKELTTASHGPDSVVYYDELARKVEEKSEALTCNNNQGVADVCSGREVKWIHKIYGYNNKGQKTVESRAHFSNELTPLTDFNNVTSLPSGYASFIADSQGRPITHYRADRSEWTTSYNGYSTTITNPAANSTTKKVNALGELVKVKDANNQEITYKYDALGSLRLIRRLHSNISGGSGYIDTVIASDHLGRKVSMDDPDKGIVKYRYNSHGELVWQQDNKQQISIMKYDSLGRNIESLAYTDFNSQLLDHHTKYYYDLADNGLGLLQKEEDVLNSITKEFTYNVMSQVIREKTSFANGQDLYSDVVYDSLFRIKETYDASNENAGVSYSYYDNYLVSKTDLLSGTLLWKFLQADSIGNTSIFQYGNGTVNYNVYDKNDGTLEAIMAVKNDTQSLQHVKYNFNSLGNLEYREDILVGSAGTKETFDYDKINRLDSWSIQLDSLTDYYDVNYDHLGNISYKSIIGSYQYGETQCGRGAGPHAVTTAGDNHYCYDANGNMTSGGGRTSVLYNTNDKPIRIITEKNHKTDYFYGLGGSRFKRVDTDSDGKVKETLYVGNIEFISENGRLNKVLRHIEGVAIDTFMPKTGVRKLEFLHRDHLGSVELISDITGNTVQKFSYDPWGNRRNDSYHIQHTFGAIDSALIYAVEDFRRGYTGHEHIDEAGLIHMNGRVYDPRLGRFLSADPFVKTAESMQSFNRYTYVSNNPLNATDPSGYIEVSLGFGTQYDFNNYNSHSGSYLEFSYQNNYQLTNSNGNVDIAFRYGLESNALAWSAFGGQKGQVGSAGRDLSFNGGVGKDGVGGKHDSLDSYYQGGSKSILKGAIEGGISSTIEMSMKMHGVNYLADLLDVDMSIESLFGEDKNNEQKFGRDIGPIIPWTGFFSSVKSSLVKVSQNLQSSLASTFSIGGKYGLDTHFVEGFKIFEVINIKGTRVFALEYHNYGKPLGEKVLHVHLGLSNKQRKMHRPQQGGWGGIVDQLRGITRDKKGKIAAQEKLKTTWNKLWGFE